MFDSQLEVEALSQLTEIESRLIADLFSLLPSVGFGNVEIQPFHDSGYFLDIGSTYEFPDNVSIRCYVSTEQELAFNIEIKPGRIIKAQDFARYLSDQTAIAIRKWSNKEPLVKEIDKIMATSTPTQNPERGMVEEKGAYFFQVSVLFRVTYELQPIRSH